ncbi:SF1B family DNA helicase RecD2 [Desulfococcus multivorans]|uniref:Helicase, RecD/TraA family n=1 Tax=Desulfococcus multivorans DSM 2059 TaxID=1121405 RepID=S7TGX5_DESML|nr:ATP-dependent RecD-like DNA helicase [Desulfococcus multivorans]AOY59850.1 helicase, RecD/TraA family [Desulfococcus multivorans]AQV02013.1 recombinase RecD [Desulfococcus multivorans]EPR35850.1 helicase, RecD/TraA family [Desulfococcus multivorans DSM 2059]SJZ34089.1 exodeoxyribonuclease V alpha subunit [Desulfococcus multivorans DSM 2059]
MLVELQGQIERITYSNEENGFTIARLKVRGRQDLVTVVGNLAAPMPGGVLKMTGEWIQHPKYGEQFKIAAYHITVPATTYGIKKYLGSGLIKGVGPVIAERIVDTFGEKSLDIIEENIEDLARVEGIGKKRIAMIRKAWEDQKEIRQVMLFLQSHGVSAAYAAKIFKFYGDRSIPVVRENPYRLAMDIFGIGFITADSIALNLGFTKDSPVRAEAGIVYVLNRLADEGHVYYPYAPLIEKCREVLSVSREILVDALARLEADKQIRIEALNELPIACETDNQAVYLSKFHVCETGIANRLRILLAVPKSLPAIDPDKALSWVQKRLAIRLAEAQERAVRCAVDSKVMVITGGPGTGKTTIVNAILKIFTAAGARMLTGAPTGRAAKRMAETTGYPAKTLHRLLKFSPARGEFEMNFENPLDCDVLIVDEASMIDTVLMHHLLKAVPATATLILVGDVNQLPSVGPGNVLGDIIASGTVPVIVLEEIFRQARESDIVVGAHRINRGELPRFNPTAPGTDFYFIRKEAPEAVLDIILKLVTERIPRRFGFDPVDDIQVLTPMHRGLVGAGNLNIALQEALNPGEAGVLRGQRIYKAGDKVMQIRNNYDKEIFNGDIGRIVRITPEDQTLVIAFDGREVVYDYADLDEIVLAYAISVHKSQGSEYPVVVMPVLVQHYMLLQRNLIYTGVTRGRNLVILVGTKKALAMGIRNDKTRRRHTRLRHRLG